MDNHSLSKSDLIRLLGSSTKGFNSILSDLGISNRSKDVDLIELIKKLIDSHQMLDSIDDSDDMKSIKLARQKIALERDMVGLDELKKDLVNKTKYLKCEKERIELIRQALIGLIPTLQTELKLESYQKDRLVQAIRSVLLELQKTLKLTTVQQTNFINSTVQTIFETVQTDSGNKP